MTDKLFEVNYVDGTTLTIQKALVAGYQVQPSETKTRLEFERVPVKWWQVLKSNVRCNYVPYQTSTVVTLYMSYGRKHKIAFSEVEKADALIKELGEIINGVHPLVESKV